MKRILIADDHEAVRLGLRAVLEQHVDWEVVAEANDGNKALAAAIECRPDVAIVDFSMPRMTGVEVARRIREYPLQTEVLIFTVHNSSLLAQQAFQAGARAFLVKSDANKVLLRAV
jgi:DNA-binding NarL/FixJ family response regulator